MTAVWAHRGETSCARENTLEAFSAAVAAGADGVELDVRLTADRQVVVHHDAVVEGRALAELPAAALPSYVPGLAQALEACGPLVVNVELKSPDLDGGEDPDQTLATTTAELLLAAADTERLWVSSFSAAALRAVGARAPGLRRGLLVVEASAGTLAAATELGAGALHPFVSSVDTAVTEAARRRGLALHVWTVNDEGQLAAMAGLGVEAVITDQVASAAALCH